MINIVRFVVVTCLLMLSSTALAATAELTWQAPTQNVDGSAYSNPSHYTVHVGCQSPGPPYNEQIIDNIPHTVTNLTVSALPEGGTCYFVVTATSLIPETSQYSNEAVKQFGTLQPPGPVTTTDITWQESEPPVMAAPVVESVSSDGNVESGGNSIPFPSGIGSDELLIMILGVRAETVDAHSGWTSFGTSAGSLTQMRVFWKASASETGSQTVSFSGNPSWSGAIYRISGAADPSVTPPTVTLDYLDSDSDTKSPPDHDAGSSKDYLWISAFVHRDGGTISSYPHAGGNLYEDANAFPAVSGYVYKQATQQTETPGDFVTSHSADWSTCTIAVHPTGGATEEHFLLTLGAGT